MVIARDKEPSPSRCPLVSAMRLCCSTKTPFPRASSLRPNEIWAPLNEYKLHSAFEDGLSVGLKVGGVGDTVGEPVGLSVLSQQDIYTPLSCGQQRPVSSNALHLFSFPLCHASHWASFVGEYVGSFVGLVEGSCDGEADG